MRVLATCLFSLFAAACGNVSSFTDAGGTDSQAFDSAPSIDANPRGLVKVTVLDPNGTGAPVTGVPVVFIEPDGSVGARVSSDTMGKAEASVLPGSSVTAVYTTSANQHQMITITGAQIGDDILITPVLNYQPAGTFTINFPQNPNANYYFVATPCGYSYVAAPASQYVAQLYQACKPTGAMTISVNAFSNQTGWLGYLDKANVMVTSGAATITGTWQSPGTYSANLTNIPAEVTYLSQNRLVPDTAGYDNGGNNVTINGTSGTVSFPAPTASSAVVRTTLSRNTDAAQQTIYQVTAGNALSYNLDVGANMLPWLSEPTLDTATGVIKVTSSGSGSGDLFRVAVNYSRTNGATNTTDYYNWTVYGATVGDVTLPQLPVEVGDVNPKAGDQASSFNEITLGDADAITGYDMVRAHACQIYLASLQPYSNTQMGPAMLLRVSYYSPPR